METPEKKKSSVREYLLLVGTHIQDGKTYRVDVKRNKLPKVKSTHALDKLFPGKFKLVGEDDEADKGE